MRTLMMAAALLAGLGTAALTAPASAAPVGPSESLASSASMTTPVRMDRMHGRTMHRRMHRRHMMHGRMMGRRMHMRGGMQRKKGL